MENPLLKIQSFNLKKNLTTGMLQKMSVDDVKLAYYDSKVNWLREPWLVTS